MTHTDNVRLVRENHYFGIRCDDTFTIFEGETKVGVCGCNEIDREGAIQVEWIEIYPEFRGRGLIMEAFDLIATYYTAAIIQFDSSEDNVEMYRHLGAIENDYDDFREVYYMELRL